MSNYEREYDIVIEEKEENDVKEPSRYTVVMLNDDYTPMDWVVTVLETYFGHSTLAALDIMMEVHTHGKGVAGVYPKDIAETKSTIVNMTAQRSGYPFHTFIEEE